MDHKRAQHRQHAQQSSSGNTAPTVNKGSKTEPISAAASHEVGYDKPPLPPGHGNCNTNMGNKTSGGGGGHLRLGGISRFLLEKAQSNDSGFDLSPATLQTLVHPLRSSTSSLSSARLLFESSSSTDESPQPDPTGMNSGSFRSARGHGPSTPLAPKCASMEQNYSNSETTIIEKTLTDDSTSKNNSIRRDCLDPIMEGNPSVLKETTNANATTHKYQQCHPQQFTRTVTNQSEQPHKDNNVFQVPYDHCQKDKSKQSYSITDNVENTDPVDPPDRTPSCDSRSQTYHSHQSNSFHSTDIAAVIPSAASVQNEATRKVAYQTPAKVKTSKKKTPIPASTKKQAGWKFLSEHVQNKEFLILEQLGKGGCGEVSLVMEKDTRKQFALKIVHLHGIQEALVQECINEVEMLIDLKGTDLVVDIHSWEFNRSEKTMKILMEKGQCDLNFTISKAIKANRPMKLLKLKYIWESLLVIVDKIHSKGIVHADLKPANFVWVDENLKIIDFGIASRLQNDLTSIAMPNPKGTLNFISPEIIKLDESGRSKLSPKSDIWALGCILYLMVYGCTPFEHISHPVTKMNAIIQGDIMYHKLPSVLQESGVISVLKLCFQTDYKRRPTAAELLRHPFLYV